MYIYIIIYIYIDVSFFLESVPALCRFPSGNSLGYVQTVLLFPAAIAWLLLCLAVSKCFPQRFQWKWARTFNAMGALMQVAFNMTLGLSSWLKPLEL